MWAQGQWGIPDVLFVQIFTVLGLLSVAGAAVVRFRLRRGHPPLRPLHPYEVAYLTGGGRHVVAAVLMSLRLDGALMAFDPGGDLYVQGEPRAANTPLDRVVYDAIRSRQARTVSAVVQHDEVKKAIEELRDGLAVQGMVLDERRRRLAGRAAWPLAAVLAVGAVRLLQYMADDSSAGLATFMIFPVIVVLLLLYGLLGGHAERTRAAKAALRETRDRHAHLDPRMSPAWTTYGVPAAAMGVALFGTAALMSIEPAFAQTAGLGRLLEMAGSGSPGGVDHGGPTCSSTASVCSSSGCSGGDGGGGSSCGSSCGGCGGG